MINLCIKLVERQQAPGVMLRAHTYMALVADEVAQVAVLHVGQNHERRALWWQADSQQGENIRMAEVLHYDPLLQELRHLLQICDA